jgi:XTP/dITP diphosphohydrolase
MSKPTVYFITTNEFKFKSFTDAIDLDSYNFERLAVETPELQADDNRTIAEYSAKWAAEERQCPVITEDVGMYIKTLNGFPGPFLSQAEKQLGAEGFLTLLNDKAERDAYWEYAVAYCDPGSEPISFHAIQKGSITKEQVGTVGWPMGKIFVQDGQTETISVLLEKETYVRNNDHYAQLRKYLSSNI